MNLKEASISELSKMVNLFPWFAAARKELAAKTGRPADAALYVVNRSILKDIPIGNTTPKIDKETLNQKIIVVGGDYFTQNEYDKVSRESDSHFKSFVSEQETNSGDTAADADDNLDFCTETLAEIYKEQGYIEQAENIYSKLSLRYPEKNAYFAALIEKLKEEN